MPTHTPYRMGSVVWRSWLGPGRIGMIHDESFLLQRIPEKIGFRWVARRRKDGAEWRGIELLPLIQQIWIDLHAETFDNDDAPSLPDNLEWCMDCQLKEEHGL